MNERIVKLFAYISEILFRKLNISGISLEINHIGRNFSIGIEWRNEYEIPIRAFRKTEPFELIDFYEENKKVFKGCVLNYFRTYCNLTNAIKYCKDE